MTASFKFLTSNKLFNTVSSFDSTPQKTQAEKADTPLVVTELLSKNPNIAVSGQHRLAFFPSCLKLMEQNVSV
uniref:Uncharacterized protein n=1 Tax=Romanomermis culicivorax TaxID=13658 RepID=A0A915ITW9_ROMCU